MVIKTVGYTKKIKVGRRRVGRGEISPLAVPRD
jgi:hypothetical protein